MLMLKASQNLASLYSVFLDFIKYSIWHQNALKCKASNRLL